MKKLIYVAVVILITVSCMKKETTSTIDENQIETSLKIKPLELNKSWCGHVASWDEFGRTSKECGGFGLCEAEWFLSCESEAALEGGQSAYQKKSTPNYGKYAFAIEVDDYNNHRYFEILLDEEKPESLSILDLILPVEKDILLPMTSEDINDFIIPQGQIEFNPSLGEFGGWKVILEEI